MEKRKLYKRFEEEFNVPVKKYIDKDGHIDIEEFYHYLETRHDERPVEWLIFLKYGPNALIALYNLLDECGIHENTKIY